MHKLLEEDIIFFGTIVHAKPDICARVEISRGFDPYHLLPGFHLDRLSTNNNNNLD